METIIYFQKKRGLSEPLIEPIGMKTYLLVRVSLDMERNGWFGLDVKLPVFPQFEDAREMGGTLCLNRWRHPFRQLQKRREDVAQRQQVCEARYEALREYHIQAEGWRQGLQQIETDMQTLVKKIRELPSPEQPIWAVYEDCLGETLRFAEPELDVLWKRNMNFPQFGDYANTFWIEQALSEHFLPRVLVLGANRNVRPVLERFTHRIKSIHWILAERDCTPEFRDYLEYFYEEYGLVISYHTFSDPGQLRRAELACETETMIFDFTREDGVQTYGVAKGSIWLDMYSSEEKQRRMECRNPGVLYISLKKRWKLAQKVRNKPFFLDTAKENGYNTWESEGIL